MITRLAKPVLPDAVKNDRCPPWPVCAMARRTCTGSRCSCRCHCLRATRPIPVSGPAPAAPASRSTATPRQNGWAINGSSLEIAHHQLLELVPRARVRRSSSGMGWMNAVHRPHSSMTILAATDTWRDPRVRSNLTSSAKSVPRAGIFAVLTREIAVVTYLSAAISFAEN